MIYEFNGYKPVVHESAFIHPQAAVTGNVRLRLEATHPAWLAQLAAAPQAAL